MIKWIVCDMDGTLLNSNNEIMEKTKKYLIKCQEKGIRLILASGRSYSRLKPYVEELEMEKYHGMLIEVNGLYIHCLDKKTRIKLESMKVEDGIKLYEETKEYEPELMAFLDEGIYDYIPNSMFQIKLKEKERLNLPIDFPMTGGSWNWIEDLRKGYPNQKYIKSVLELPDEFNKICILHEPSITEKFTCKLKEKYNDEYEFCRSTPRQVEITKKGITKGNALNKLMQENQINKDEVLVFGDGENDFSLFETVKYSIAMGNAPSYVKKHAFDCTDSNNEDGIYQACLKYIGNM